ncbi:MAG: GNAT family N-acetyltransferase [Rhodomicrobium sp.]
MESIECAKLDDVAALAGLLAILFAQEADFAGDRSKQERALRLIIANPETGAIFIARNGSVAVGMVSLLFTVSTAQGGPACWLEDMVLHPDWRGGGLGTQLLQHAIDWARGRGFTRISLLTDKTNEGAIRFYRRQGFVESAMTVLRLPLCLRD